VRYSERVELHASTSYTFRLRMDKKRMSQKIIRISGRKLRRQSAPVFRSAAGNRWGRAKNIEAEATAGITGGLRGLNASTSAGGEEFTF